MNELRRLDALGGLITNEIGHELYTLAKRVEPPHAIVEIGSYRGKSTAYLAAGASDGVPMYAVDPWEQVDVKQWCRWCQPATRHQFETQLRKVGLLDCVTVRQGLSVDVAAVYDGPKIGLLFIDGDHSARGLSADIRAWVPLLKPHGVVAVDDFRTPGNPDVERVVSTQVISGTFTAFSVVAERLAVCQT